MSEFRFSGYGQISNSNAAASIVQASLTAQLAAQNLQIGYLTVTQTGGIYAGVGRYIVSLSATGSNQQTITNKVNAALQNVFSSNDISLTNVIGASNGDTTFWGVNFGGNTYTVKAGDTLSKIGAALGVNWQTIASLNGIKSPYTIRVGQVLKINGGASQPTNNNNAPVIIQPNQLPQVIDNNPPPPEQPKKNFLDDLSKKLGVAPYVIGIAGLAVVLVVLSPRK